MRKFVLVLFLLAPALLAGVTTRAQAQYFGKNKVQYKQFQWHVLETDNFEVYYYEGTRDAAYDAARMAERSYNRLSHILGHEIRDRIPLILYASHSDFQQTNISPGFIGEGTGGVTEFLKRRVYLPFTGSYAELEHVLTHELVHAFQVDVLFGGDGGKSLLSNPFAFQPPLWFMEGMAEYLSMGGVDPNTEMWLRDGALQGYLTPIPILSQTYDIRVYRYGQAIFEYIARRYGPEKIGVLLKRVATSRNMERSFQYAIGMSLERLSEDWTEEVRRTYLPQIADFRKPGDFSRAITDHVKSRSNFNVVPAVSPEGDKVAFISDRELNTSIYLASTLDGSILGRLVEGESSGDLEALRFFQSGIDFSPDGRNIVFPAKSGGKDDLYVYDIEKRSRVRRIKLPLDGVASPSWSPDGSRIVFAGFSGGRSDLYVCDADGGNLQRLTEDRHSALDPRFSPDGRSIVFTTDRGTATDFGSLTFSPQRLAIYDLASGEIEVLPYQAGKSISPFFSPQGDALIFVSDRGGISNLYRYHLESGVVVRLTDILTGISGITSGSPPLSVSRNGKRLVFSAFERGGWNLYAIKDPFELAPLDTVMMETAVPSADFVRRATGLGVLTTDLVTNRVTRELQVLAPAPPTSVAADSLIAVLARPDLEDFAPRDAGVGGVGLPGETVPTPGENEDPIREPGAEGAPADFERPEDVDHRSGQQVMERPGDRGEDEPEDGFIGLRPPPGGLLGAADRVPPDSLMAALNALPDTASFAEHRYRSRFSTDFGTAAAAVGGGFGLAGQAVVGFSDILGDKQILVGASVFGSITESQFLLQYTNLSRRTNYGLSLFQFRNDFLLSTASSLDEYQSNIYRGGEVFLSRPFNLFTRVELGLRAVSVTERIFRNNYFQYNDDLVENLGTAFYVQPTLALVKDTALYGYTGPIKGTRARVEVSHAVGGNSFTDLTLDYRRYFNINQRYSLATRVIGATSFGDDPQIYRVGGPFTLRAVDYGELEGSHTVLASVEFRYPFIDYLDLAFPLPMRIGGIRGAIFFDAGTAWGETYLINELSTEAQEAQRKLTPWTSEGGFHLDDVKAAYGFGVRMNLGFFLVRWDLAWATDLRKNLGKPVGYFALGGEF